MLRSPFGFAALAGAFTLSAAGSVRADPIVFSAAGADAAAVTPAVNNFRAALGGVNNGNTLGSVGSGRREINWDGGGAATTLSATPFAGFNTGVPRGAVFTTPGTGFVQAPPAGLATQFMNPTYSGFPVFSPQRLFSAVGSNVTDTLFFIPGSDTPAATTGFGAVFSDVDAANSTSLQFFDVFGNSLGTFFAPAANNGLSFLGVLFNAGEQVARVRIASGNVAPGPNDAPPGADVVMMDDFIFGEPRPQVGVVPEPGTLAVLGGLAVVAFARRRATPRAA